MSAFDDLKAKAQDLLGSNSDKVEELSDQAIEKAGDAADQATDGKYADQVDQAQAKADDAISGS